MTFLHCSHTVCYLKQGTLSKPVKTKFWKLNELLFNSPCPRFPQMTNPGKTLFARNKSDFHDSCLCLYTRSQLAANCPSIAIDILCYLAAQPHPPHNLHPPATGNVCYPLWAQVMWVAPVPEALRAPQRGYQDVPSPNSVSPTLCHLNLEIALFCHSLRESLPVYSLC